MAKAIKEGVNDSELVELLSRVFSEGFLAGVKTMVKLKGVKHEGNLLVQRKGKKIARGPKK